MSESVFNLKFLWAKIPTTDKENSETKQMYLDWTKILKHVLKILNVETDRQ